MIVGKASHAPLVLLACVSACAAPSRPALDTRRAMPFADTVAPPFATRGYEPLSRAAVVAIALREWRLFGQPVDDDPPNTRPPPLPEDKPERQEGLWQRVGEYWWGAIGPDDPHAAWTGKHDDTGTVFPASIDGQYAWSAAFVGYVMRIAGAGAAFPYSENHSDYINAAREGTTPLLTAERLDAYAPQPGDLICLGRGRGRDLVFDDLPTPGRFPGHCDIVVARDGTTLSVIGGNVDDAVTMKHVPTTPDGKLAGPDGTIIDPRYHWLTVLRVNYGSPIS